MKHFRTIALPIVFVCFAGCSTPEERAHEAQEKVHNERLQLVDDYKLLLYGALLFATMRFAPDGLAGIARAVLARSGRGR